MSSATICRVHNPKWNINDRAAHLLALFRGELELQAARLAHPQPRKHRGAVQPQQPRDFTWLPAVSGWKNCWPYESLNSSGQPVIYSMTACFHSQSGTLMLVVLHGLAVFEGLLPLFFVRLLLIYLPISLLAELSFPSLTI